MVKSFIINNYLSREYLKITLNMTLVFFSLGFIINLFEEINLFKDYEVGMGIPILLTLLFIPSLIYNMFPFIILLSGIWFFQKIKKTDEIIGMRVSGMSNFSVIMIPSVLSLILGVLFIAIVNPITSSMVMKYESIKSNYYEKEQDYLASVTDNGIWIKEKNLGKNFIIRSSKLDDYKLINLTIYEFDENNNFVKRIEAKSANISTQHWIIKDASIIDKDGITVFKNGGDLRHASIYDIKKIRSLYSNLDTVSFWNLSNEIKLLTDRGYSTKPMRSKLHQSLAFPFFLLSMILLSGVFTLGMHFKGNNWTYTFIAIITSIIIFYFNDFSAALGKTDKLPIEVSVWMPIVIIFIFSAVGIIHANQK